MLSLSLANHFAGMCGKSLPISGRRLELFANLLRKIAWQLRVACRSPLLYSWGSCIASIIILRQSFCATDVYHVDPNFRKFWQFPETAKFPKITSESMRRELCVSCKFVELIIHTLENEVIRNE
jgi:hypothetical protein